MTNTVFPSSVALSNWLHQRRPGIHKVANETALSRQNSILLSGMFAGALNGAANVNDARACGGRDANNKQYTEISPKCRRQM